MFNSEYKTKYISESFCEFGHNIMWNFFANSVNLLMNKLMMLMELCTSTWIMTFFLLYYLHSDW